MRFHDWFPCCLNVSDFYPKNDGIFKKQPVKLGVYDLFVNFEGVFLKENSMSLNKVMLIGNVGKEPDVRYLDNGVAVASVVLATSERGYRLQNGTEVPERTEWHNIVFWRGLAETVEKYVHKGDKLFVEGKIRSRSYDDQNGVKRYVTEIFADNMEMLTPRMAGVQLAMHQPTAQAQPAPSQEMNGKEDLPF